MKTVYLDIPEKYQYWGKNHRTPMPFEITRKYYIFGSDKYPHKIDTTGYTHHKVAITNKTAIVTFFEPGEVFK